MLQVHVDTSEEETILKLLHFALAQQLESGCKSHSRKDLVACGSVHEDFAERDLNFDQP